jgi:hypothetical protein
MIHACCAFCCLHVMRCCTLRAELHLRQLLSHSFFIFRFFLSLAILIVVEGRSDTPELPLCLRPLGWLHHAQLLL